MIPFIGTAARVAATAVAEFLRSIPAEAWLFMGGMLIGSAGSLYGVHKWSEKKSSAPAEVPVITFKEGQTQPEDRMPSRWDELTIFEPPPDTVVETDTIRVPEEVAEEPEPTNGLPRATYDADLIDRPELTRPLPYAVVPFQDGQRPDLALGPEEGSLRVVNPRTAGWMEYTYAVPQPLWQLTASGSLGYSQFRNEEDRIERSLSPALSLNLARNIGPYTIEGSGSLTTGDSWWSATITIERSLWTIYE
jgi:hypothetical protein